MKKLLCLALCFAVLCLAGCSSDGNSSAQNSSGDSIDSIVMSGKLDGVKYGLGASVAEVKEYYSGLADAYEKEHSGESEDGHDHDQSAPFYFEEEKDGYTEIDIASARFYYENGKEDKGISAIATDGATFSFTPGLTTKYEVEAAISAEGETVKATEPDFRFLAVRTEPVVILRYEFGDYQLDYYFYDNTLITTVIIDTNNWEI